MAQDGDPEQEMLVVEEQEQFFPKTDPEPEMGAAAAAVCDAPPPQLRQNPSPTPSETATDNGGSVQLSPTALEQMTVETVFHEIYSLTGTIRAKSMAHPLPPFVKVLPQPPAKPRPTEAIRLRRGRLKSTEWGKC